MKGHRKEQLIVRRNPTYLSGKRRVWHSSEGPVHIFELATKRKNDENQLPYLGGEKKRTKRRGKQACKPTLAASLKKRGGS